MATTTKTLTPTNQTITLPDMTERPDANVLVDGIGKDADAINALSDQMSTYTGGVLCTTKAEVDAFVGTHITSRDNEVIWFNIVNSSKDDCFTALLNATTARVCIMESKNIWNNHPQFIAYDGLNYYVGILDWSGSSASVRSSYNLNQSDKIENLLKTDTATGTTDANGYLSTTGIASRKVFMATLNGYPVTPVSYGGNWLFFICYPNNGMVVPYANHSVTVTYYYY